MFNTYQKNRLKPDVIPAEFEYIIEEDSIVR